MHVEQTRAWQYKAQVVAYLLAVKLIPLQISCRSPEKVPVSPLVVGDVSLHLVLDNFIWQEHPFNPGNLQPRRIQRSDGKITIKKVVGGWKDNCKLFRLKSSWRSSSDGKRSVLPSDFSFLFIYFWQGARWIKTARAAQRHFYLCVRTDSRVKAAPFPLHPVRGNRSVREGARRSAKGECNRRWWVRKTTGLSDLRGHMRIIWNDTNMESLAPLLWDRT